MQIEELKKVLDGHKLWLDNAGGSRAYLSRRNLSYVDLSDANLSRANLFGANLFGADLSRANLFGANLFGANLSRANLSYVNLSDVDLSRANLSYVNLSDADLSHANLSYVNLSDANLSRANLTGETWEDYVQKVVPDLLKAGGKTLEDILSTDCWDCHSWSNCPISVAFDIKNISEAPILLKSRIRQFVQLFDLGIIPKPIV